jgi:hypothetical protein
MICHKRKYFSVRERGEREGEVKEGENRVRCTVKR